MDMSNRETHDFMNVESFSQLPFIRPAPVKEKNSGIRLFGIEFGGNEGVDTPGDESESAETTNDESSTLKESSDNGNESNRRFECHYCCRNFPTSQALGGHQNAHKRERQHAKRAHLQSAMVHGTLSDAHIYGLVNYRIGPSPTSPLSTYHHHPSSWSSQFPTSSATSSGSRFYSGHHSSYSQQPINGSPLGMWRIPSSVHGGASFHRERSAVHPLPLFSGEEFKGSVQMSSGGSSSQAHQYGYETKASVKDHVSLDLHL